MRTGIHDVLSVTRYFLMTRLVELILLYLSFSMAVMVRSVPFLDAGVGPPRNITHVFLSFSLSRHLFMTGRSTTTNCEWVTGSSA